MGKDVKIFLGLIAISLVIVIVMALKRESGEATNANSQPLGQVAGMQISPESYSLGEVPLNGGIVTKEYELKNDTNSPMVLQKIVTSCMCTEAQAIVGNKQSRFFGMEHPGDRNPNLNYEINPGESAKVVVNFDPAAHGPQGVGPFDRVVMLTFSEPAGYTNLTFNGTVVK